MEEDGGSSHAADVDPEHAAATGDSVLSPAVTDSHAGDTWGQPDAAQPPAEAETLAGPEASKAKRRTRKMPPPGMY